MLIALALAFVAITPDTTRRSGPADSSLLVAPSPPVAAPVAAHRLASTDTLRRRRAVEHSDLYYTRLAIHRYSSYALLPLFVGEYVVGQRLYDRGDDDGSKNLHLVLASGIGALFGVNAITGGWNLVESWGETGTRRKLHSALMLLAGAGFATTALLAPDDDEDEEGRNDRSRHRAVAIGSGVTGLVGYALMIPDLFH